MFSEVLESTREVLNVDPNNVKAHYRSGKVRSLPVLFCVYTIS